MKSIFPDIDKSKIDDFYIKIGQKSTSFYSNCENFKNKEHFNLEHLFLISNVLSVEIEEFFK